MSPLEGSTYNGRQLFHFFTKISGLFRVSLLYVGLYVTLPFGNICDMILTGNSHVNYGVKVHEPQGKSR
jgi:hypothetical protein